MIRTFWVSKRPGWLVARLSFLICVTFTVALMVFEDRLIYYPAKYPEGFGDITQPWRRDGEILPQIEDCWFTARDGVKLHGWYCTPHRKTGTKTVPVRTEKLLLWFHGNAGNIAGRYDMMAELVTLPVDIFIIDYRGYGRSEGTPSEEGLYSDAAGAWDYLTRDRGIPAQRVVILGKSLGGAIAIDLASKVEPAGLIVQSSFTSIPDMADTIIPFVARPILHTKMDSINKIGGVTCPKLFIHSPADEVVPYKLGRRLFDRAPEPKRFYEVKGAHHNETYLIGGNAYFNAIREFVLGQPNS